MKILVVIPAFNEEENIIKVVEEFNRNYPQYDYIVVDDGSRDDTAKLCNDRGLNIIELPINLGLSGAFQTGVRYAVEHDYMGVMQFDADGQHKPEYIEDMIRCMEESAADIVIGSRYVSIPKPKNLRMFGSYLIAFAMWLTTGQKICDPTSGMRLFNRKVMREFAYDANFSPEPDTISYLMANGAKVCEVQVSMGEREAGESYLNFVNSMKYMIKMGMSIVFIQWFRKRNRGNER